MIKKIFKTKNKKGFVILFAVTLAAILLSIALGVASIALKEIKFGTSAKDTNDAFLAADTAAECALYYDSWSSNSFPLSGPTAPPLTINCASLNIPVKFVGTSDTGTYSFSITGLGSGGSACAKVEIFKDNSIPPMSTFITVTGYNIGDSSCNSTNANRVVRELKITDYVPSGNLFGQTQFNQPPIVDAGAFKSVTLPASSTSVVGTATDSDGIASSVWTFSSGPSGGPTPSISTPNSLATDFSGMTSAGTYTFRLTATDNLGATGEDFMQVVVSVSTNIPPSVSAGVDKAITLPTSSTSVTGTASDPDGTISSTLWSFISGPGPTPTIATPSALTTTISNMTSAGTYTFRLAATDNATTTSTDDMQVVVTTAPITLDSTSDSGTKTGTPLLIVSPIVWNHTVGPGSQGILIVSTASRDGSTPASISYNGTPMIKVRGDANISVFSSIWYLVNPAQGTHPISVSVVGATNFQGSAASLFGVNQVIPVDAQNGANGNSAGPVTVDLTTNTANTWIADVAAKRTIAGEALTMIPAPNRVQRINSLTSPSGIRTGVSSIIPAVAASLYTMGWTTVNVNSWAISAVSFKQ